MIVFEAITAATRTAKQIQKFVEGDLVTILSLLGENEFKAAASALQKIPLARKRENQVLQAIGHLESAHIAYRGIYAESKGWKDLLTLATRMAALQKDVFTLCLMAICYRYVGEVELMKETLRTALEAIKPWHRFRQGYTLGELANPSVLREYAGGVFSAIASWANAGSWPLMVQMAKGEFPDMSETDVLELCRALKYEPAT